MSRDTDPDIVPVHAANLYIHIVQCGDQLAADGFPGGTVGQDFSIIQGQDLVGIQIGLVRRIG